MKKLILGAIVIALSSSAIARDPFYKRKSNNNVRESHCFSFNYCSFQPQTLNNYFAPFHQSSPFGSTYYTLGTEQFTLSDGAFVNEHGIESVFSVQWMLPMKSYAGTNDSLSMKLGGWQMMSSIFGYDLLKSDVVDLEIGPAWTFGTYKLRYKLAGINEKKYKNAVIAPGGRVDLKFVLGAFVIGGRASYCYDISDPIWKRKSDGLDPLPGYSNRGFYYVAYIGYVKKS